MMLFVNYLDKGDKVHCKFCGKEMTVPENAIFVSQEEALQDAERNNNAKLTGAIKQEGNIQKGSTSAVVLKFLAWATIAGSALIALIMMLVAAIGASDSPELFGVFIIYIFVLLVPGIAMGVMFLVASYSIEHLIEIRKTLERVLEA